MDLEGLIFRLLFWLRRSPTRCWCGAKLEREVIYLSVNRFGGTLRRQVVLCPHYWNNVEHDFYTWGIRGG